MVIVGNKNGYLGVGFGRAPTNKEAIKKAARNARLNIFPIRIKLMPAPRGLNLCAPDEIKKIFRLAGIKDIRMKSRGQTGTRLNFIYAVENALKNLNKMRL